MPQSAKTLERKAFSVSSFKSLDGAQGIFEGYLGVFGNEDHTGDIIERGAFTKTLSDARELKTKNNATFLYPLLWMHDPNQPIGGIAEASEDSHGLYVKGQCDLDTEMGRRAFSGMQKGYMSQMSIGYDTVKATRDKKGIRHLTEVRLWEGSAVTTGFAANPQANILATKTRSGSPYETKAVGGKTSWPLADRAMAWDNGAAHNRIVAWATGANDKLDEAKMKSVHFWYDPANSDKLGGYKLLFCDVVGGEVKAVPRAIEACTGSHGIQGVQGVSAGDMAGIKSKISTYYGRMRSQFNDDSMVPSWEQNKHDWRRQVEAKGLGGLQTLTATVAGISYLVKHMDTLLAILGDATGLDLEGQLEAPAETVGDQLSTKSDSLIPNVQPAVQIMLDSLPGLKESLFELASVTQQVDIATSDAMELLGMEDLGMEEAWERGQPVLESKAGRAISNANIQRLNGIADNLDGHAKALRAICGTTDVGGSDMPMSPAKGLAGVLEPELSATTPAEQKSVDHPEPEPTTLDSDLEVFGGDVLAYQQELAMRRMLREWK